MAELKTLDPEAIVTFVKQKVHSARNGHNPQLEVVRVAVLGYQSAKQQHELMLFAKTVGMDVEVPDVEHAALALLIAVESLPELSGRKTIVREQVIPDWPRDGDVVVKPAFPSLWALCGQGQELVLIGGSPVPQKLEWLREVVGQSAVSWIGTEDDSDATAHHRLVNQMKAGRVVGVVYFPEFSSHMQTQTVIEGGRASGVPVLPGGKAGQGSLLTALQGIEMQLTPKVTP